MKSTDKGLEIEYSLGPKSSNHPKGLKMSDKFRNAIKQHKLWVDTLGKAGKQLYLEDEIISDLNFSSINLSESVMQDCILENIVFCHELFGTNYNGCTIISSDLTNSILVKSNWNRVRLENSLLNGINAFRCSFISSAFINCNMTGGNFEKSDFSKSSFDNVIFSNANFSKTSFHGASFKNVIFKNIKNIADINGDWISIIEHGKERKANKDQAIEWISNSSFRQRSINT